MSLSSSLNELIIRGYQMKMHAVQEGLYGMVGGNDHLRETLTDWIIDLTMVDTALNYFIAYERDANRLINEAKLENAKMNYELSQYKDMVKELQEKIDRWAEDQ
jgi:hypothetical protein